MNLDPEDGLGYGMRRLAAVSVLSGRQAWDCHLAWNLTLAAVCCMAACRAYNNGSSDCDALCSHFLAGLPDPELLGPYPTKDTT
jgi:hypothetical protein